MSAACTASISSRGTRDSDTVQVQGARQRAGPAGAAKDSDVDRAWATTPHGELSNSPRRLYNSPRSGRAASRAAPGLQRSPSRSAGARACED